MAQKTEKPTARRLRKAREQGDVPVSAALSQAIGFVAALALLPAAAEATFALTAGLIREAASGHALQPGSLALLVLRSCLPLLAVAGLASFALSVAQSGGLLAFGRIAPQFERLSPAAGLRSLFGLPRVVGVLRALVAAALVTAIGFLVVRAMLPELANTAGETRAAISLAGAGVRKIAWYAAFVGLFLGALDLVVVRRAWLDRWMMTRDELRRELRESEGDPEIKAHRRRAHREMLASATLHSLKNASVVIVNPTHLATALRYDEGEDPAPRVLAQGQGEIAESIVRAARAYGVPVVRDIPVAQALAELEIGDEIPEALYRAVAEILREVWEAEGRSTP